MIKRETVVIFTLILANYRNRMKLTVSMDLKIRSHPTLQVEEKIRAINEKEEARPKQGVEQVS